MGGQQRRSSMVMSIVCETCAEVRLGPVAGSCLSGIYPYPSLSGEFNWVEEGEDSLGGFRTNQMFYKRNSKRLTRGRGCHWVRSCRR